MFATFSLSNYPTSTRDVDNYFLLSVFIRAMKFVLTDREIHFIFCILLFVDGCRVVYIFVFRKSSVQKFSLLLAVRRIACNSYYLLPKTVSLCNYNAQVWTLIFFPLMFSLLLVLQLLKGFFDSIHELVLTKMLLLLLMQNN